MAVKFDAIFKEPFRSELLREIEAAIDAQLNDPTWRSHAAMLRREGVPITFTGRTTVPTELSVIEENGLRDRYLRAGWASFKIEAVVGREPPEHGYTLIISLSGPHP